MSQRLEKVQKLAKEVLGETMQNLKDPRIGFVTVTAVRISADLRHGRVFVSVLGTDEEKAQTMAGLESAKPYLRTEMGRQMRLKYTPELVFELDEGVEVAARVEEIIRRLHDDEGTHEEHA
ncbi:MAG TPA: 30S ribosome-binding factor RbfA [Actinomycetota bacterium]|nr:30S ribosome-binding factor RbfA [Actinomycetota bacterium]